MIINSESDYTVGWILWAEDENVYFKSLKKKKPAG